jgi:hypothetical protein
MDSDPGKYLRPLTRGSGDCHVAALLAMTKSKAPVKSMTYVRGSSGFAVNLRVGVPEAIPAGGIECVSHAAGEKKQGHFRNLALIFVTFSQKY